MHFLSFVWDPSTGLDLGIITLHYYSLMFVIAFGLGWFIMKRIYVREGIPLEKLDSIFIYAVVATLIGARLGHVFFYDWDYFQHNLLEIFLPFKFNPFEFTGFRGLASHGAAVGIIVAMYFYSKKVVKKPLLWVLDRVVIPVACGAIFVRIGNFINSEIIGKPTGTEFGVIFMQANESQVPRHPTQLYEAGAYLLVFLILWFLYWKTNKREKQGYLFGLFLVLLWSVRFLVEFIKENQVDFEETMALNMGQWLSIPFVILGLYFMFRPEKKLEVRS